MLSMTQVGGFNELFNLVYISCKRCRFKGHPYPPCREWFRLISYSLCMCQFKNWVFKWKK